MIVFRVLIVLLISVRHSQTVLTEFAVKTLKCNILYGSIFRTSYVRYFQQCVELCELNEYCQSVLYSEPDGICRCNRQALSADNVTEECGQTLKYAERRDFCSTSLPCPTTTASTSDPTTTTTTSDPTTTTSTSDPTTTTSTTGPTTTTSSPDTTTTGFVIKKSLIEKSCFNNSGCDVTNSACIEDVCRCLPGYSYDSTIVLCVSNCGMYGTAFQFYPNSILVLHIERTFTDFSEYQCTVECINEDGFVCRSIDYHTVTRTCHLFSVTASSEPESFAPYNDTLYRQRDCL